MRTIVVFVAVVAVAVALALGGGYAFAQKNTSKPVQAKGKTSSTTPSAEEVRAACEQRFNEWDQGNKGYLTINDFEAAHYAPGKDKGYPAGSTLYKTQFQKADKNKDNKVTLEEYCGQ